MLLTKYWGKVFLTYKVELWESISGPKYRAYKIKANVWVCNGIKLNGSKQTDVYLLTCQVCIYNNEH